MKTFSVPYLVLRSSAPPAISNSGELRLYYDTALNSLMQSEDGNPWSPVGSGDVYATNGLDISSDGVLILSKDAGTGALNFSHQYRLTLSGDSVLVESSSSDPTGINNPENLTFAFDDSTRTFTVGTDGTDVLYSADGRSHRLVNSTSIVWPDISGMHLFYFDSDGYLESIITPPMIDGYWHSTAPLAIIYWNADIGESVYRGYEAHSSNMPGHVHAYLHNTRGAAWESGLELTNFILNANGSLDSHAQFGCADGIFYDEDIRHKITNGEPQDINTVLEAPTFYRIGTAWRRHNYNTAPIIWSDGYTFNGGSGLPAYNLFSAGVWSLAEVGNDNFVLLHVVATNDISTPIITICGINQYNTIGAARSAASTELANINGLPFAEIITIGTIIYQVRTSYANTVKARIRSIDGITAYIDLRSGVKLIENSAQLHSSLSGLTNLDHPASAIYTDTTNFDGYVLTDTEINVQLALDALSNQISLDTAISELPYSASVSIDFSGPRRVRIGVLTGDIEFTSANLHDRGAITVRITADATPRALTFPVGWQFYGTAAPAILEANTTLVLSLLCWGSSDADVDAAWVKSV